MPSIYAYLTHPPIFWHLGVWETLVFSVVFGAVYLVVYLFGEWKSEQERRRADSHAWQYLPLLLRFIPLIVCGSLLGFFVVRLVAAGGESGSVGETLVAVGGVLLFLAATLCALNAACYRVRVHDDALQIRSLFRRADFTARDIAHVSWYWRWRHGTFVVRLNNGETYRIPYSLLNLGEYQSILYNRQRRDSRRDRKRTPQ